MSLPRKGTAGKKSVGDREQCDGSHKSCLSCSKVQPNCLYTVQRKSRMKRFPARVPGFESVLKCCPTALAWAVGLLVSGP